MHPGAPPRRPTALLRQHSARLPHRCHWPVQRGRLVHQRLGRRIMLAQPLQQRLGVRQDLRQDLLDPTAHSGRGGTPGPLASADNLF